MVLAYVTAWHTLCHCITEATLTVWIVHDAHCVPRPPRGHRHTPAYVWAWVPSPPNTPSRKGPSPHDVILSRIKGLGEVGRFCRKPKKGVCDLYNTRRSLTVMQKAYRCGIKETGGVGVGREVEIPPITPCTLIYDKCLQI